MNINFKNQNRKGQAILFAVVGVTIALAVGVTVASRNLSSISRVSRSDTSERAFAAAEGGIEKLLILSGSQLTALAANDETVCEGPVGGTVVTVGSNTYCEITYPVTSGDPIVSKADLKVETYSYNDETSGTEYLALDINKGDLAEVNLRSSGGTQFSGNLTLCWEDQDAAIYYSFNNYGYSGSCDIRKGALYSNEFSGTSDISGFSTISNSANGFYRCTTFSSVSGYDSLRIRVLYNRTLVGIFASGLTGQGYKLSSLGKISGQSEVVKKIVAFRSYPFMSAIFDSGIFTATGTIN